LQRRTKSWVEKEFNTAQANTLAMATMKAATESASVNANSKTMAGNDAMIPNKATHVAEPTLLVARTQVQVPIKRDEKLIATR
jgi:hypothetical protein